jgi:hypothetical protein
VKAVLIRASPKGDGIYAGTRNDVDFVKNHLIQTVPGVTIATVDEDTPAPGMSMGDQILREVERATRTSDHVVVYYTGHGDKGSGSLDLRRNSGMSPKRFMDNWLATGAQKGKKLTLMVDACYSGNWVETFASLPPETREHLQVEIYSASSSATTSTSANFNFQVGGNPVNAESTKSAIVNCDNYDYRELQGRARSLGVSSSGTKEALVKRINQSFTYKELQAMAREKGIPSGGAKAELIERLDLSNQNDLGSGTQYLMNMSDGQKRFHQKKHEQRPEYVRFGGLDEKDSLIAIQGKDGISGKIGSVAQSMQVKADGHVSVHNDLPFLRKAAEKLGVSGAVGGVTGGTKEDLVNRINKAAAKKKTGKNALLTPPPAATVDEDYGRKPAASPTYRDHDVGYGTDDDLRHLQEVAKALGVNAGVGGRSGSTKQDLIERINAASNGQADDFSDYERKPAALPTHRDHDVGYGTDDNLRNLQEVAKALGVNAGVGGRSGSTKQDLIERINAASNHQEDEDDFYRETFGAYDTPRTPSQRYEPPHFRSRTPSPPPTRRANAWNDFQNQNKGRFGRDELLAEYREQRHASPPRQRYEPPPPRPRAPSPPPTRRANAWNDFQNQNRGRYSRDEMKSKYRESKG